MVSAVVVRPVGARSTATGGQRSSVGVSELAPAPDCRPVQHDSLWLRLNPEATDYDSRTRLAAMPVESDDERGRRRRSMTNVESIQDDDEVMAPKRKRQNLMKLAPEGEEEEEDEERRRMKRRKGLRLVQQQTRQRSRTEKRKTAKKVEVKEPWQCRMESKWKKMDDGVFPPYVLTGRCKQKKCMMGLYECTPRKYVIKVLKKVDAACFPVPTIAVNSTYEEAWTFADYKVTVGCDCVQRSAGTYYLSKLGQS